MKSVVVYGIHSTGSIWKFVFINERGVVSVSKDFPQTYALRGIGYYDLSAYVLRRRFFEWSLALPKTFPAAQSWVDILSNTKFFKCIFVSSFLFYSHTELELQRRLYHYMELMPLGH
jgi:hypothetical protein